MGDASESLSKGSGRTGIQSRCTKVCIAEVVVFIQNIEFVVHSIVDLTCYPNQTVSQIDILFVRKNLRFIQRGVGSKVPTVWKLWNEIVRVGPETLTV